MTSASEQTSASKRNQRILSHELSDDDKKRIYDKWVEIRTDMHNTYKGAEYSTLLLAEYVTIYERSRQPDELSKAQARIAELEAEVADLKTRSFAKSGEPIPCNDTPSGYFTKDMI